MEKNQTKENEYTYENEFGLLQSFMDFFYITTDSEKDFFNSTQLRRLIDDSDIPCISLKTFDTGIRLINEKLNITKNPLLTQSELNSSPLHTRVFYQRLPSCLCLPMSSQKLYDKKLKDKKHKEIIDLLLVLHTSNFSSYTYTFDIHKFCMPPFLAPLFIGIIGSLKKGKKSWKNFRESVLEIIEAFYNGNSYNEKPPKINQFLPENADTRMDLYTYWLEIHFPDELFSLLSKFDKIINNDNDRILSYNLKILADGLFKDIFLTRNKQNGFLQHIAQTLESYLNTPMIDPITFEPKRPDLCEECESSLRKFHTEEIILIQELYSKQGTSP